MINQMWSQQIWALNFRIALNDREVETLTAMLQLLGSYGGISECPDGLRCKLKSKGFFSKVRLLELEYEQAM